MTRTIFENEYFCENCGKFIGVINNAYYDPQSDLMLCRDCEMKNHKEEKKTCEKKEISGISESSWRSLMILKKKTNSWNARNDKIFWELGG